jgi:hypothetical protein
MTPGAGEARRAVYGVVVFALSDDQRGSVGATLEKSRIPMTEETGLILLGRERTHQDQGQEARS